MAKIKIKSKNVKNKEGQDNMKNKKNNGITLIALVITIIVLLILAGVTIATLTGENGILTRASQASEQTEIAEEKEAIGLAYTGVLADNNGTGVSADKLQEELEKNGYNATVVDNGDGTLTVTFESGNEYTIDANGNISEPTISNIIATMKIVGEKVTNPPVPTGFTYTGEGTVDTGYVIQDSNGNEFVWVPVDKNQKIQINVTSKSGNIESISLTDPYGDNIILPDTDNLGISYSNTEIDPIINGTYKLSVTVGEETKEVELNVNSLYAQRMWELDMLTEEIAIAKGYENLDDFMQKYFYMPEGTSVEDTKAMIASSYKQGMFADTEDYTNQVNANGGFYIGRYEASESSGGVAIVGDVTPWNNISQINALSYANSMYTSSEFTSSLLTGAAWDRTLSWLEETGEVTLEEIIVDSKRWGAWDRTLSWLEETGEVTLEEIIVDSKRWGNYADDTFSGTTSSGTTSLINTGSMTQTRVNNIYDLAGNLFEWTTEADDADDRVLRGRLLPRQWLY